MNTSPPIAVKSLGFWTYQDLMKLFSRSYMTIYVWKTKRNLPHIQLGPKRVVFPKKLVLDWAASQGIAYHLEGSSPTSTNSLIPAGSGQRRSLNLPPTG